MKFLNLYKIENNEQNDCLELNIRFLQMFIKLIYDNVRKIFKDFVC